MSDIKKMLIDFYALKRYKKSNKVFYLITFKNSDKPLKTLTLYKLFKISEEEFFLTKIVNVSCTIPLFIV